MDLDFFVSSDDADKAWGGWLGWTIESFGYSVFAPLDSPTEDDASGAADFYRTLHEALADSKVFAAVYSANYAHSDRWPAEWHTAYVKDPLGEKGLFIPLRIERVKKEGLLIPLKSVDLFGLNEEQARTLIKNSVFRAFADAASRTERVPDRPKPPFPGEYKMNDDKKIGDKKDEDLSLDEDAALALLEKRAKITADKHARALVKRLACSSKSVGNAARYLHENSISCAEALAIMDENGDGVFNTLGES